MDKDPAPQPLKKLSEVCSPGLEAILMAGHPELIATPRSGHFIQNSSKLDYFYSLVATSPVNHIENCARSLWFVKYLNRSAETLSSFWFWMKQLQHQRAAILFKILVNQTIYYQCWYYSDTSNSATLHNEMRPRGPPMRAPVCVHPFSHVL
jgi:hypothetical protein